MQVDDDGKTIHNHGCNKEEVKKIAITKLKRCDASEEKIAEIIKRIEELKPKKIKPSMTYEFEFDINRFKLEALKIAYEYSVIRLGEEYLDDPIVKEIRELINKAIKGQMAENVMISKMQCICII